MAKKHSLSGVDELACTAVCSNCGPVRIRKNRNAATWRCFTSPIAIKSWRQQNPDKVRAQRVRYLNRYREKILDILGRECVHCGYSDVRALQVDHVDGDGYLHRKGRGYSQHKLHKDVAANPARFQTLCANCNWIKRTECGEHKNRKPVLC